MTAELALVHPSGGLLDIRQGQTELWTKEQRAVLGAMGVDKDVTNPELAVFRHVCEKTGLDPFRQQIYLIGRWDKREGRKVYRPQTGIGGFRRIAQETGQYAGRERQEWCGDDGVWKDVWLSAKPPAACRVTVRQITPAGVMSTAATCLFREYVVTRKDGSPDGKWGSMPANQIAKCTEAAALRCAFPDRMSGLFIPEEMERDDAEAEAAHSMQIIEAASRKTALAHEHLAAQTIHDQSGNVDRGKGPAPQDLMDDWHTQDAERAVAEGLPEPDRQRLEEILAVVQVADGLDVLRESWEDGRAALGVQRITERGWALVKAAVEKRRGQIEQIEADAEAEQ